MAGRNSAMKRDVVLDRCKRLNNVGFVQEIDEYQPKYDKEDGRRELEEERREEGDDVVLFISE